ncbi:protein kinase domain-containing protein [Planctomicrobium sp. SH664]|uniref:serine/threonine-protein kinase n=1 Tax=Planctomicrobium sp. SH664 TaxID=3448125 RepID=UPI003F5B713F
MTEPTAQTTPTPPPERIGSYRIERELGAGGMGTVYLGQHVESGREAAIKMLPASMGREAGFVARFNREIAAMQQLKSPNVVELYESGEDNGIYYYAMEYVPGETLTSRLKREKRLPWRMVIDISVQVCKALKAAHNCGIVHRDIKPSNLLLDENGTVKLTDFGIAQVFASSKLTVTGGILGTAEYMSPEQAAGQRATKQSDIYSLGAVMYVMLTGRPPFTGKTTLDIVQKHRFSQFDSPKRIVPEIPFWLDEIVCKCLAKKVEDRYPDAYVLGLRLQEVAKKVDFRDAQMSDTDEAAATNVTQADGGGGLPAPHGEVGGTLVRDLLRTHLESQQQSTGWSKFFDNGWVLFGLLMLLIGGGYGLSRMNRLTPEVRFERGEKLMESPEGPAWEEAKRDYFAPLVESDPEVWGPKTDPYLSRIRTYELKKGLLGRELRRDPPPASEPEAILRQVLELRRLGLLPEALAKLAALETLLAGNEEHSSYLPLVQQLRTQLSAQLEPQRLDYVRSALARADELQAAGEKASAAAIWRSIIELYQADPDAASQVAAARQKLHNLSESAAN